MTAKLYEDGKLKTRLAVDPPPKVEEEKEPNLENSTPCQNVEDRSKLFDGLEFLLIYVLEAEILRFPRCCWMPSFGPLLPRN